MATMAELAIDTKTQVLDAVRKRGSSTEPAHLIKELSQQTGIAERVFRGVIWGLIATGRLDLTPNRRLCLR
jgi:hypothetical protein